MPQTADDCDRLLGPGMGMNLRDEAVKRLAEGMDLPSDLIDGKPANTVLVYEPSDTVYTMSRNGHARAWVVRADGTFDQTMGSPAPTEPDEPEVCPSVEGHRPGREGRSDEGRFCPNCQDYEGTCDEDHCWTCGGPT